MEPVGGTFIVLATFCLVKSRVIVLVPSCCKNEYELENGATPVDDRRSQTAISLIPGVVPPPTPAVALGGTGIRLWPHLLWQCHAYVHGGSQVP